MAYAVSASHTLDKPVIHDLDSTGITTDDGQTGLLVQSTDGRKYKRVLVDASSALTIAGGPVYHMVGTTANEITSDYTDTSGSAELIGNSFAGVACVGTDAAATEYIWMEVPNGALTADASCSTEVTVCAALMAADDLYFQIADSDALVVAIAMEADSSQVADIVMLG